MLRENETLPATLLNAKQVAGLLNCTVRSVWRLVDERRMPAPRRIGRRILRWHPVELQEWIDAGCKPITEGD